jgi:hypothetical protein
MPSKTLLIVLLSGTIPAAGVAVFTNPGTTYVPLLHTLSVGFLISALFFFLVVYYPERQRRSRIKANLQEEYRRFKLSCIGTFLILSNSQDYGERDQLLYPDEFKRYFKLKNKDGEGRRDAVANTVEENAYYLGELVYQLRIFNDEIRMLRNSVDLHDKATAAFFRHVSQVLHRMEATEPHYEDVKSFCRFLWEIFAGWDIVTGYRKDDYIDQMLGQIK